MARVTKAELEQQVKELDEKCNEYIKQLINKDNDISSNAFDEKEERKANEIY